MILTLDKNDILNKILIPVSRVSEECSLKVCKDQIFTIVNDVGGHIILYIKVRKESNVNDPVNLNFKDVKKIIKVFNCVNEPTFDVKVGDNASTISHRSKDVSFKIHLVNDNIIRKNIVNIDKINNMSFNSVFELPEEKLKDIIKGSIISQDINKAYIYTEDGSVYFNITDLSVQNTDNLVFKITESYEGDEIADPISFNLDILRLLGNTKNNRIKIKINNLYKILFFEIEDGDILYNYILSAYVK